MNTRRLSRLELLLGGVMVALCLAALFLRGAPSPPTSDDADEEPVISTDLPLLEGRKIAIPESSGINTPDAEPQAWDELRVRVRVAETGKPVEGARVFLTWSQRSHVQEVALTDRGGLAQLRSAAGDLAAREELRVNVQAEGLEQQSKRLPDAAEHGGPVEFLMDRGASISGQVVDDSGRGVAGARVIATVPWNGVCWPHTECFEGGDTTVGASAVTGSDGEFVIRGLTNSVSYDVGADAEGFARSEQGTVRVRAPRDGIRLALLPTVELVMRYVDEEGLPFPHHGSTMVLGQRGWLTSYKRRPPSVGQDSYVFKRAKGLKAESTVLQYSVQNGLYEPDPARGTAEVRLGEQVVRTVKLTPPKGAVRLRLDAIDGARVPFTGAIRCLLYSKEHGRGDRVELAFQNGKLVSEVFLAPGSWSMKSEPGTRLETALWRPIPEDREIKVSDAGSIGEPLILSGTRFVIRVRDSRGKKYIGAWYRLGRASDATAGHKFGLGFNRGQNGLGDAVWLNGGRWELHVGVPGVGYSKVFVDASPTGGQGHALDVTLDESIEFDPLASRIRVRERRGK